MPSSYILLASYHGRLWDTKGCHCAIPFELARDDLNACCGRPRSREGGHRPLDEASVGWAPFAEPNISWADVPPVGWREPHLCWATLRLCPTSHNPVKSVYLMGSKVCARTKFANPWR